MTQLTQEEIELAVHLVSLNEIEFLKMIDSKVHLQQKETDLGLKFDKLICDEFKPESHTDLYILETVTMSISVTSYVKNLIIMINYIMENGSVPKDLDSVEYIVESLIDIRLKSMRNSIMTAVREQLVEFKKFKLKMEENQ